MLVDSLGCNGTGHLDGENKKQHFKAEHINFETTDKTAE